MKGSIRLITIAGIDIQLHWTFGLLIIGLVVFFGMRGLEPALAVLGIAMVMALFICVVLHELGHALAARRFDVPTRDITLYPIGGVARLQRIPEESAKEFWIAVAGPAVNVGIAFVLLVIIVASGMSIRPANLFDLRAGFWATLFWMNVVLVAFNMLPAFPMDGGRVLRALLASKMDYTRATELAAGVGQGMALLFAVMGVVSFNPILLFIALFVYFGAQQEARYADLRSVTKGISVRRAMLTRFEILDPDDTLDVAVERLLRSSDQSFPIIRDDEVVGMLTRKRLMKALEDHGLTTRIRDVEGIESAPIEDSVMLDQAFKRMQEEGRTSAPVVRSGRLVGVLTLDNIAEVMMITTALQRNNERRRVRNQLAATD